MNNYLNLLTQQAWLNKTRWYGNQHFNRGLIKLPDFSPVDTEAILFVDDETMRKDSSYNRFVMSISNRLKT